MPEKRSSVRPHARLKQPSGGLRLENFVPKSCNVELGALDASIEDVNQVLRNVLSELHHVVDLKSFLEIMLFEALRSAGTNFGAVALLGDDPGFRITNHVLMERGRPLSDARKDALGIRRPAITARTNAFIDLVQRADNLLLVPTADNVWSPSLRNFVDGHGVEITAIVPMRISGRLIGWLGAGYENPERLDQRNQSLLRTLGDQMAIAVEMTRLGERSKNAAIEAERLGASERRASQIVKASQAMSFASDLLVSPIGLSAMLGHILKAICEQLFAQTSSGTLWLFGRSIQERTRHMTFDHGQVSGEEMPAISLSSLRIVESVAKSGQWHSGLPFICHDIHAEEATDVLQRVKERRHAIAVPMTADHELLGLVMVDFPNGQLEPVLEDMQFAQSFANQATMALQLQRAAIQAREQSRLAATQDERARIARDIHDTLAQGLSAIMVHVQVAKRTLQDSTRDHHLHEALDAARSALEDTHQSIFAIRTNIDHTIDVAPVIEDRLKKFLYGANISCEVRTIGTSRPLTDSVAEEMMRIIQEAATNTLKHARATRFSVLFDWQVNALELVLADDGAGFDVTVPRDGFGLVGIRERVARIGATLRIKSAIGCGTALILHLG